MTQPKRDYVLTVESNGVPLLEEELDVLAAFLMQLPAPQGELPLSLSMVDGFFHALSISPTLESAQAWLSWILGDVPSFGSEVEAHQIVSLLLRHFEQVQHDMREENHPIFAPLYLYNEQSDAPWVAEWCDGFMSGVQRHRQRWDECLNQESDQQQLKTIHAMTLLVPPDVERYPEASLSEGDDIDRLSLQMRQFVYHALDTYKFQFNPIAQWEDLLELCVMDLRDHLLHPRQKDNQCPCGSRKIFTDCCGSMHRQLH